MSHSSKRTAVLLINLGSPEALTIPAVRRYLDVFLSDPRVLDMPAWQRWLLLQLIVLRTRPKASFEKYSKVWLPEGSPLYIHTRNLSKELQAVLDARGHGHIAVRFAMRYSAPLIPETVAALAAEGFDDIIAIPQYPQYAASSTGTALVELFKGASLPWNTPNIRYIQDFYDDPGFITACAKRIQTSSPASSRDFLLFSFHGLPIRHVQKSRKPNCGDCMSSQCCDVINDANTLCYRAQCHATARAIAVQLGLQANDWGIAFQSQFGKRDPWITPFTFDRLRELAASGIQRLAVFCPSFTADCLETLEEVGMEGRDIFLTAGGKEFAMIPCPNADRAFAEALANMVERLIK